MRRRTFDALVSTTGLLLAAVLGFFHLRYTSPRTEILPRVAIPRPAA